MSDTANNRQPSGKRINKALLAGCFLLGGLSTLVLERTFAEPEGMRVDFSNVSDTPIESIRLDFGNADGQSSLLALRIAPGDQRALLLNQEPGMGFNVRVKYAGGRTQEFCALKGDERRQVKIDLKP